MSWSQLDRLKVDLLAIRAVIQNLACAKPLIFIHLWLTDQHPIWGKSRLDLINVQKLVHGLLLYVACSSILLRRGETVNAYGRLKKDHYGSEGVRVN
jgi:hypothetical protein